MTPETADAIASIEAGATADSLETDTLEFKQPEGATKADLKMLADAAVCFANARGGEIVVGVADGIGGPGAFGGVPSALSIDVIRKGLFDRTRPPLTCFVREEEVQGQRVVIVSVPEGAIPHSNAAGLATRRLAAECLPYTPEQQREVLTARGQIDFSAEVTQANLNDLSAVEFERLRVLLRIAGKEELAVLPNDRILDALRLRRADGQLTNAALLLLGTEDALTRHLPAYGYSYQFRPSMGSEATARLRERRPVLAAVENLIDAIASRLNVHPLNLAGGVQLPLSDYPLHAVREIVVNAMIHRSYETNGTVDIEHTPDQLTIASPGGLVAGVTPNNILTYPSTPRNRLLTETVATLQVAERTGQGVDRAYREMLRSGKEPPQFEDSGTLVRVALPGGAGNDSFVRFVNDMPDHFARDVDVLLIFSWLRNHRTVDAAMASGLMQRTLVESQRVLSRLEQAGYLDPNRRTATRANPTYRLRSEAIAAMSRAVSYGRRGADDIEEKVVEHVREYDFVTNRTLQRMFDISVYAARDLIADLRSRGVLAKIGEARGGPGVRYGRGAKFPG